MNPMIETFALGHAGIGRTATARTLVQRLVRFSPQAAQAVDPLAVGRFKSPIMSELDLSALLPQPLEEGENMPATTLTHASVADAAAPIWQAAQPALVQVEPLALPSKASSSMPTAPSVVPAPANPINAFLQPQDRAAARIEVFALAAAASALPPQAASASAEPQSMAAPPVERVASPQLNPPFAAPESPALNVSPPVPVAAGATPASAAAQGPVQAPPAPLAAAPAPAHALNAPAPSATPALPEARPAPAPVVAVKPADRVPQHQAAPIKPALMPPSLMGKMAALADAPFPHVAAPPMGIIERLVEATRHRTDEAVVRIGSVSVVMRPAPPPPPAQASAPTAALPSATPSSVHRNPWLSRGRGGE